MFEETGLVQAHVFASKTECFKCQTPKPETAKAPHFHDWICPKCNASNFASKTNCFRCHTPKDGSTQAPREFRLLLQVSKLDNLRRLHPPHRLDSPSALITCHTQSTQKSTVRLRGSSQEDRRQAIGD
mmetsp:Transcript_18391/g.43809  ORF Transcript_18391/g.43809 Transcript_18391/m.43809 type:complete len:128 (+) Transcript_18391:126-509(+)